jgi:hypothetical protein
MSKFTPTLKWLLIAAVLRYGGQPAFLYMFRCPPLYFRHPESR